MPRGFALLATFGLTVNVLMWGVPAFVAASALPRVFLADRAPELADALATAERSSRSTPGITDALVNLVGAESEAMQVASMGLHQPPPPDLAARADHAGNRVLEAVSVYVRAVAAVVDRRPN